MCASRNRIYSEVSEGTLRGRTFAPQPPQSVGAAGCKRRQAPARMCELQTESIGGVTVSTAIQPLHTAALCSSSIPIHRPTSIKHRRNLHASITLTHLSPCALLPECSREQHISSPPPVHLPRTVSPTPHFSPPLAPCITLPRPEHHTLNCLQTSYHHRPIPFFNSPIYEPQHSPLLKQFPEQTVLTPCLPVVHQIRTVLTKHTKKYQLVNDVNRFPPEYHTPTVISHD